MVVELEVFTSDSKVLGLECRGTGQLLVDDVVKFFAGAIRQTELFYKLPKRLSYTMKCVEIKLTPGIASRSVTAEHVGLHVFAQYASSQSHCD